MLFWSYSENDLSENSPRWTFPSVSSSLVPTRLFHLRLLGQMNSLANFPPAHHLLTHTMNTLGSSGVSSLLNSLNPK